MLGESEVKGRRGQQRIRWLDGTTDSVMPSNHLIHCCPLLLLPSIFPTIRVFFNESALHVRWPNYWNFVFSISPSDEYSGLIFFRTDCFDLLVVQGTLDNLLFHILPSHMPPLAINISTNILIIVFSSLCYKLIRYVFLLPCYPKQVLAKFCCCC